MADKVGVFDRLGWATSGTTASVEFEFLEGSSLGLTENFIDVNALRGSRSHPSERVKRGTRRVDGTLNFCPTPLELDTLLPLILGGTKSVNTIPLAETLPAHEWFGVRDGTIYHYNSAKVESATFTASEGGPLQVSMQVVGKDEVAEGSMGSLTTDLTGGPYTLMEATASIGGNTYEFSSVEISVVNALEVKFRNSATPTQIVATDRIVTLSLPISLGDGSALYGSALAGLAATITFTSATRSLVFSMAAVQAPKAPLPFGQRGILDFPWRGVARMSSTTRELVVTNDSTV